MVRQPTGAIAGGNAFAVQPVVQLRDVGGNAIALDSQSSVVASVVASPSVGRTVRIDTRRDPIVEINRIFSVPANQIVAPGSGVISGIRLSGLTDLISDLRPDIRFISGKYQV